MKGLNWEDYCDIEIPKFRFIKCRVCGNYYFSTDGCPLCRFKKVNEYE